MLLERVVRPLADRWGRAHPEAALELEPTGTALGFRELLDGEAELVVAARDARPSEEEQARARGFSLDTPQSRHIVAVDVVGVAVHTDNPVDHLTYDDVVAVFCTGEAASWAAVGGPDRPIHALAPDLESGARALAEDFFCGVRGIRQGVPVQRPDELQESLRTDVDAISFVSLADGSGKLLGLAPAPEFPPVFPSQSNIIRGSYPLYGDVYLLTRGVPTGALASFLAFVTDPAGQEIIDEQRYVPLFLRPSTLDEPRPLRETVHFEAGAAEPDSRSLARLHLLVREIRERQVRHVVLEGYTDDREPDPYALSEQRAQSVRTLLAAEVPTLYFEIIPRGARSPIGPNQTPLGRQINRRVQVYLGEDEQEPTNLAAQ
jgi:phosphate transport system substrate-binding protein